MITVRRTEEFDRWLDKLRDRTARANVLTRLRRLTLGNPGDVAPVGEGVSEMRIHFGPGYRVYFTRRGSEIVFLLCGGDNPLRRRISQRQSGSRTNWSDEMVKTYPFDVADYLDSPEMIAAYLTEVFKSDEPALISKAIGDVARARGMAAIAEKAGLSRENLYRALGGDAKPEFATVIKVLHALGINIVAQPRDDKAA